MPSGPIDEIQLFVWRNAQWQELPEEQQEQIKECLKQGEQRIRVAEGGDSWLLDTTGRNGWMQVRPARRRPVMFLEQLQSLPPEQTQAQEEGEGCEEPEDLLGNTNMRLPRHCSSIGLVAALDAEWQALTGPRGGPLLMEQAVAAWVELASAGGSSNHVFLQSSRDSMVESSTDEGLVRMAARELWAIANLAPCERLGRDEWMHMRLLEVHAPSQFALAGLGEVLREQGLMQGNRQLHRQLLEIYVLCCRHKEGPEDGKLSTAQLKRLLEEGRTAAGMTSDFLSRKSCSGPMSPTASMASMGSMATVATLNSALSSKRSSEAASPTPKAGIASGTSSSSLGVASGRLAPWHWRRRSKSARFSKSGGGEGRSPRGQRSAPFLSSGVRAKLRAFLDKFQDEEEVFVNYYDFLNHMMERKRCPVRLHQYDLSAGKAWWLSPMLLCRQMEGIWHTGVVVFDREYWYGGRIFESKVGQTPYGQPTKVVDMGEQTMRSRQELWHFVQRELQFDFTANNYDVLANNCNHFSDALCSFLINRHIPEEVLKQPQQLLRTPVISLVRAVLNRQLGAFGGQAGQGDLEGSSPPPSPSRAGRGRDQSLQQHPTLNMRPGVSGTLGSSPEFQRAASKGLAASSSEEEWEQVEVGDLVLYEYQQGWSAVARVDVRFDDSCDLHWFDTRLGQVHVEEEVPHCVVRLLPGVGGSRDPKASKTVTCSMCL